jgi:hypothetical protein
LDYIVCPIGIKYGGKYFDILASEENYYKFVLGVFIV